MKKNNYHLDASNALDRAIILFVAIAFLLSLVFPQTTVFLWIVVALGSLPTIWEAIQSTIRLKISIDTFNVFAIAVSFVYGEAHSTAFIILMLESAKLLNAYTQARTTHTLEELLKLKPDTAIKEERGKTEEINSNAILEGDILVVEDGARVPVDGLVIFGSALINESSLTGESMPVEKNVGDTVLSSTLNESGLIKIRATRVGKDSTIEKMAELVKEAGENKSRSEKLADRFATIYLPIVLILGLGTYLVTKNVSMTAAIFLVACADDMAVAIPLAITAAMGKAAKRGVIIKGGERIELLSKIQTLVIDKTGTLTHGTFVIKDVQIEPGVSEHEFWQAIGIVEKFSDHPTGRAIFKEALKHVKELPDPENFKVYKGSGVAAEYNKDRIAVGDYSILSDLKIILSSDELAEVKKKMEQKDTTWSVVVKNTKIMGFISLGDVPKPEAKQSIATLKKIGVVDIRMFTGDNDLVAHNVAKAIGIEKVEASMLPNDKLTRLEEIMKTQRPLAMVGDGVNDAAALARADVGIAMGQSGSAVAVQAADIVILNDDLSRLPEMIIYARKVMSVIRWDMVIWLVSNIIGFGLVFLGIAGPVLAAFYNFISDFFPLLNSARLFSKK